jgi:hypothetical protein
MIFFFHFNSNSVLSSFLMTLLVDIRNLKRIKRLKVEKTIFCGFKRLRPAAECDTSKSVPET